MSGLLIAGALELAAAPALAAVPPPAATAAADRAQSYTFAFRDAEISAVAEEILGKALGVTYAVDPSVTGKMSFRIDQKLTRAQLFEAFEASLAANDVVIVRNGDSLLVQARAKAKIAPQLQGGGERQHRAGYQTIAVPLSYATPSEVAKALSSVAPASAVVSTDDKLGLIILGGTDRELTALMDAVKVFDQSGLQASRIRWYELSKAPAAAVADELSRLLTASGAAGVAVVPLKRLNGIYVFAHTPQALDEVGQWIERLDVAPKDNGQSFWVYHPRSVSADGLSHSLASLLFGQASYSGGGAGQNLSNGPGLGMMQAGGQLGSVPAGGMVVPGGSGGQLPTMGGMSSAGGGTFAQAEGGLSSGPMVSADGLVRIGVDKESNTLLVAAPPGQWVQIQKILNEIDRPPSQILIEASILEVSLTNDTKLGVDWRWMGGDTRVISSTKSDGTVSGNFPGLAVTFLNKDIKGTLSALGARTALEVVSAPKIMTLNNRTARLEVGDQVPIISQSAQSVSAPGSPIIDTVNYRSTGVILNVTPQITDEDKVMLAVEQEVSTVASTDSSSINSPTIQQRRFESTLVVNDGGTVALGGLISANKQRNSSGVPGLSSVPWIGSLFGSQTHNNDRTELIVLLTATIVRDQKSSDNVMANLTADMHEIANRGLLKQR